MTIADDIARALQVLNPAQLWLRFYGRFLFVNTGSDLVVLAVNACSTPTDLDGSRAPSKSPNGEHKIFLTIREVNARSLSIEPASRLVGTEVAPFLGALNVWNIDGYSIEVSGKAGKAWPTDKQIPLADLNVLAPDCKVNSDLLKRNHPLHPHFLSVIRIPEGSQFSYHLPTKDFGALWEFVDSVDRTTVFGSPNNPLAPQPLADMVQIAIDLPEGGVDLTLDPLPSDVVKADSRSGSITVTPFLNPLIERIVVVSFSNLCSTPVPFGPGPYVDTEFTSFYNVFVEQPQKLFLPQLSSVVRLPARESELRQRNPLAANTGLQWFRPMGDCFLGATVSA